MKEKSEYLGVNENNLSLYIDDAKKERLISREEEIELVQKIKQGDENARAKLIKSNIRFVISIAKKYQNNGLALEDLISEGNIGLVTAADRFEPDKGYHFISYAVYWIKQSILKAINGKSRLIRLPLNKVNDLISVERIVHKMYYKNGYEPNVEEIATALNRKKADIAYLINVSEGHLSLDAENTNKDTKNKLVDTVIDKKSKQPDQSVIENDLKEMLLDAVESLDELEIKIITHRYGLYGHEEKTLRELGDTLNLTKERIRQIEKKALRKIRHMFHEKEIDMR